MAKSRDNSISGLQKAAEKILAELHSENGVNEAVLTELKKYAAQRKERRAY